jgi:hypothetical protein
MVVYACGMDNDWSKNCGMYSQRNEQNLAKKKPFFYVLLAIQRNWFLKYAPNVKLFISER